MNQKPPSAILHCIRIKLFSGLIVLALLAGLGLALLSAPPSVPTAAGGPAAGSGGPAAAPGFADITEASGALAVVRARYEESPKWWLSGLHLVDLDGDGHLD